MGYGQKTYCSPMGHGKKKYLVHPWAMAKKIFIVHPWAGVIFSFFTVSEVR